MVTAQVRDLKGKQVADMPLATAIFTETTPADIATMHSALLRQLSNTRSGSANTKTRAEVRGGGAKPWRQKGTGRARAGSRRSPLWAGGGIIFGPKPRDFTITMPAKMRRAAIKSALAAKVNDLVIVDSFSGLKETKTKAACQVLHHLKLTDKKLLVVVDKTKDKPFALSVRNIKNVTVVQAENIGVKELLDCEAVLTSQAIMESISNWLAPAKDETKQKAKKPKKTKTTTAKSGQSKSAQTTQHTKAPAAEKHASTVKVEKVHEVEHKTSSKKETTAKESPLQSIANTTAKSHKPAGDKPHSSSSKAQTKPKKHDDHPHKGKGKGK